MRDRSSVIGEITVELIKKHGTRMCRRENLVTGFGRSAVIANGLSTIFTDANMNKIEVSSLGINDRGYEGNYFFFQRNTPQAKVVNLLLNQPAVQPGQGVYKPTASELVAFAYNTSASAANEGIITDLADGTSMKKRLTRRFSYGSSIAGTFDTIATSLITPSGNAGTVISIPKQIASVTVNRISARYLKTEKVQLLLSDNSVVDYDLTTGVVTPSQAAFPSYAYNNTYAVFEIGDYVYEINTYSSQNVGTCLIYGFDNTGTLVYTSSSISGTSTSDMINFWYDATADKYYITAGESSSYHYELVLNSSGLITSIQVTSDSLTLPASQRIMIGTSSNHIYTNGRSVFAELTDTSYYTASDYPVFIFNGHTFTKQIAELGNLVSYHTFSVPFIKDVGDILNVSYSYFID